MSDGLFRYIKVWVYFCSVVVLLLILYTLKHNVKLVLSNHFSIKIDNDRFNIVVSGIYDIALFLRPKKLTRFWSAIPHVMYVLIWIVMKNVLIHPSILHTV